jgi:glycine/D-amino acid oxidase-like deaminating enzyme
MRICIVGAGIAGCHAAFDLAADHDVTVLDRVGIAAEATGYSAGLVAPTQYYPDRPAIARHANGFFADFDGTHGFEFTERDRLDVVTEAEAGTVRSTADELADAGFPVDYLAADEIPDRYPRIRPDGFAGAVRYGDTGWVDPYTYATALKAAAEADGATFEVGVEVENVRLGRTDDHAARTDAHVIRTDDGRYEADAVVLARRPGGSDPALSDPVRRPRTRDPARGLDPDRSDRQRAPLLSPGTQRRPPDRGCTRHDRGPAIRFGGRR